MAKQHDKPWLSHHDQLRKLKSYGLIIDDEVAAIQFLEHINYYRFSGYGLAFESGRHVYLPGTTFESIRAAYEFDRALRDLLTEALEIVELDLRTTIAYRYSKTYGAFGHVSAKNHYDALSHEAWIKNLRKETGRSKEVFINHHRAKYAQYPDIPIWVATEIMSFGSLSRMYANLLKVDQKSIVMRYRLQPRTLASWIHHLVYVRNLCAHHARLWDRIWDIKPELPAGAAWQKPLVPGNMRLFATLLIQNILMRYCSAELSFTSAWRMRVERLMRNPPDAKNALARMGLPEGWFKHPHWCL